MEENNIKCWNCDKEIEKKDRYCKYCGKEQKNNDTYLFELLNTNCWKCNAKIERKDKHCKDCGTGQDSKAKFPYTLLGILLQFLLVGPFVIPKLYKTPLVDKRTKQITLIIIVAVTIAFIGFILFCVGIVMNYYSEILKM